MPNTNIDQAVEVAERLRNSIEQQTFTFDHVEVKFTISLGVTVSQLSEVDGVVIEHSEQDELAEQDLGTEESLDSLSKMIKRADAGMYKAKQNGRNQTFSM
ncbi:response regulator PleD [Shewanella sp. P1-14-1]|nr:response regulator PleD [Shewanella sp. P1-14-1]